MPAGGAGSTGGRQEGSPSVLPRCGPQDLVMAVHWERDGAGLRGQVIARNIGARACRLPGKPAVTPLALDGTPLAADTVITLEMIQPGYVILRPGQSAAAPLSWRSWCGQQAADHARVTWDGGHAVAQLHGPVQPECSSGTPGNLSSSWFRTID